LLPIYTYKSFSVHLLPLERAISAVVQDELSPYNLEKS
jgi:hypothetical protein